MSTPGDGIAADERNESVAGHPGLPFSKGMAVPLLGGELS